MNGVNRNKAEAEIAVEVLISRDIATTALQAHLHVDLAAFRDSADVDVLIENLDIAISFDHARGNDTSLICTKVQSLGAFASKLKGNLLEVQNNIGCILNDAGNRLKLMQHTFDTHGCYSSAF